MKDINNHNGEVISDLAGLYNQEVKEKYLNKPLMFKKNKSVYKNLFEKSAIKERWHSKDLSQFTDEEINNLLSTSFEPYEKPTAKLAINNYKSWISKNVGGIK